MTAAELKPWHDSSACPACNAAVATPFEATSPREAYDVKHMICPACGHDWDETDVRAIAAAWYWYGAWEGKRAEGEAP